MRAVIFDMDGTLLNTERIYVQAWKEAGKRLGYPISDENMARTRCGNRKIYAEVFGEDFPFDALWEIRSPIVEKLIAQCKELLKPGVRETLEYLRNQGVPMAVATSTRREKAETLLRKVGILDVFQAVIAGDMATKGKPDPEIYWIAARELGVTPEQCLVMEDTATGCQAAMAAGMAVILNRDCGYVPPEIEKRCILAVNRMDEAIPLLERMID